MLTAGYTINNNYKPEGTEGLRELNTFRNEFAKAYIAKHGPIKRLFGVELLEMIDNSKAIADKKLLPLSIMYTFGTFAFESLLASGYTRISKGLLVEDKSAFRAELRRIAKELDQEAERHAPKEIPRLTGEELLARIKELPQDIPKDQLIEACGYYTVIGKKRRKDYQAYNQALVAALKGAGIYADHQQKESQREVRQTGESKELMDYGRSISIPEWALEDMEQPDDVISLDPRTIPAEYEIQMEQEPVRTRERLRGYALAKEALSLHLDNIPETSICIRCGFKTDDIGLFRRAFSRATNVALGPLSRMVDLLSASSENAELMNILEQKLVRTRFSQAKQRNASFRDQVFINHGARCVCCDIEHPELLEAAHIVPVLEDGVDRWQNGIPLCPTHHCAFDRHFFAFDPTTRAIKGAPGVDLAKIGIKYWELKASVDDKAIAMRYELFRKCRG